ncbi:MAG: V-type ATPase 116kDa subunit family protein [Caldilineaceae bacterium]
MFTPERMREVNLFIQAQDIQRVTATLARLGMFQVEEERETKESAAEGQWATLANGYATQERRLAELLAILQIPIQSAPTNDPINLETDLAAVTQTAQAAEQAIQQWQHLQQTAQQTAERLRLLMEQLRLLAPIDLPVERLAGFRNLHLTVGAMPSANLSRIQTALFRIPFVIIPAYEQGARTLVFAATTQEYAAVLDRALRSAFFEPIPLPADVTGSPAEALAELSKRQAETQQQLAALDQERRQLAQAWTEHLRNAWQQARTGRLLADVIRRFALQGQIYLIAGWTPVAALPQLIETMQTVTEQRAIIEVLEPDATSARPPTLLRNPKWLQAFEGLVTNFGFPAYAELDPTALLAFSFILMYGMMFGDVGHGLLLALAGVWLQRHKSGLASLAPVLVSAGLSAGVFGLLYGSFLGMALFSPLWVRPLDSITAVLLAAVVAGVVLLNLGFVLNMFTAWRSGDWSHLLLDKNGLAGLWLYWALLGGGLALLQGVQMPQWLWALLILIPVLLLFLHEPLANALARRRPLVEGGWGEYSVLAVSELFETLLGYVSNSLSFIRLGAFAVAHEGLSQVIFLLAGLSGGLGWVIIVVGTLLIVGFEGLIVGIQTLRLEYYEFFGKFFGGAGRPFTPLRLPEME